MRMPSCSAPTKTARRRTCTFTTDSAPSKRSSWARWRCRRRWSPYLIPSIHRRCAMQVLITGSREATAEMRQKAREVVDWCITEGHTIVVGEALGIDHEVRKACWQQSYELILV